MLNICLSMSKYPLGSNLGGTGAPKKLDAFSSFRPGQTVTKYCACHTILRVSLKVANQKSQRTVNAMQNEPCSLAHLKS